MSYLSVLKMLLQEPHVKCGPKIKEPTLLTLRCLTQNLETSVAKAEGDFPLLEMNLSVQLERRYCIEAENELWIPTEVVLFQEHLKLLSRVYVTTYNFLLRVGVTCSSPYRSPCTTLAHHSCTLLDPAGLVFSHSTMPHWHCLNHPHLGATEATFVPRALSQESGRQWSTR